MSADDEALRLSVEALMRPTPPPATRQLRTPIVSGRVLLDLRAVGMSSLDATDEANRLVRQFWCPVGADVMLLVSPKLPPLPFLIEPIVQCEPGAVNVVCSDGGNVSEWVQALRTPQVALVGGLR